jgi:HK97 family phage major capsid protein
MSQFTAEQLKALADAQEKLKLTESELRERMMTLEQRLTAGPTEGHTPGGGDSLDSVAEAIRKGLPGILDGSTRSGGVALKASDLLGLQTKAAIVNSGDTMSQNARLPGVVGASQRRRWVRSLLPIVRVDSGSQAEFLRATHSAQLAEAQYDSPAREGVTKKESAYTFELVALPIPTLAHWTKASRQVLADNASLSGFLRSELLYGLELELERQILVGDGTGGDMPGLCTTGSHTDYAGGATADTYIDTLRRAIGQLEAADHQADAVVVHPDDWTVIELVKESTTNGYVAGQPRGANPAALWNVPVFTSTSMTEGQFLVADLAGSCGLHLREDARLLASEDDGDNFRQNLITMLAELRAVLAVYRSAGVIHGSF